MSTAPTLSPTFLAAWEAWRTAAREHGARSPEWEAARLRVIAADEHERYAYGSVGGSA